MIIKSFVALGILVNVDNMFVTCLPEEVMKNGRVVNKQRLLILGEDHNTTRRVIKRLMRK